MVLNLPKNEIIYPENFISKVYQKLSKQKSLSFTTNITIRTRHEENLKFQTVDFV